MRPSIPLVLGFLLLAPMTAAAAHRLDIPDLCRESSSVFLASLESFQTANSGIIVGLYPLALLKEAPGDSMPGMLDNSEPWCLWIPDEMRVAADAIFKDPQRFIVFVRPAPPDLFPSSVFHRVRFVLADPKFGTLPGEDPLVESVRTACAP